MPRMTQIEYSAWLARTADLRTDKPVAGCDDESELHEAIRAEVARRGGKAWGGRMDKRSNRDLGEPDFHVWLPGARYFAVECKTKTGKLKPEQLAAMAWANKCGIRCEVVRSLAEFVALVESEVRHD